MDKQKKENALKPDSAVFDFKHFTTVWVRGELELLKLEKKVFIKRSELFKSCDKAFKIFDAQLQLEAWGDNEHSLVKAAFILQILSSVQLERKREETKRQMQTVIDRLNGLGPDCLVDLET
jgi:hypothetical protein